MYGYSPNRAARLPGSRQGKGDFLSKYLLPAIALAGFGHWVAEYNVVVASLACLLALVVFFRGFLAWCNTRLKIVTLWIAFIAALLAFAWFDGSWVRQEWTPTFLYLTPSHELFDCERRAFFVNHSGFKSLQNINIVIKDNKSGAILENDDYRTGIEPGPQNPDAPRYIWVKPSRPWDEDYTITVTGTKFHSVQETVLRSNGQHLLFAVGITVGSKKKTVASCRDSALPESYALGRSSRENCDALMAVDPSFAGKLRPKIYGFQLPNGSFSVVRVRKLPSPSDLDSQSEDRHLTEYEQTVMKAKLSRYRETSLLILYAGGRKTFAYAAEFCDFFRSLQWRVEGPRVVPPGAERLVDVQISVSKRYWNTPYPRAADLLTSLDGIKHRQRYVYDDAVSPDMIVLWVGPKSPDNFLPDDCVAAVLRPKPGEPHSCEAVAQTISVCPFLPREP
jgi:hypothetical protein